MAARADCRPGLTSAASSAPDESFDEIDRAEPRERRRLRSRNPLRGGREMRRRRVVEDARDIRDIVTGVFRQFSRRHEAHEVDNALEIG